MAEFLSECLGEHFVSNYDLLEAFDIFRDQLDAIPVENVGDALRALGFNPTESEVMQYINKYDTNADGHLDLEEWKAIVHAMKLSGKVLKQLLFISSGMYPSSNQVSWYFLLVTWSVEALGHKSIDL